MAIDWGIEQSYIDAYVARQAGITLHYHRAVMFRASEARARAMIAHLGLTNTSKVILLGVGFGWTTEVLETTLPGIEIVNTDTSPYIQSNKDTTETADIQAAIEVWIATLDFDGIALANVNNGGSLYREGDLLRPLGGTFDKSAAIRVSNVTTDGVVTQVKITNIGEYSVLPGPTGVSTITAGAGTGLTLDITGWQDNNRVRLLNFLDDGGTRARVTILDENLTNQGSRNRVSNVLSGPADWVVTENMLLLPDDGGASLIDDVDAFGVPTCHIVMPRLPSKTQDPGYVWRTMAEWRIELDLLGFTGHSLIEDGQTFGLS